MGLATEQKGGSTRTRLFPIHAQRNTLLQSYKCIGAVVPDVLAFVSKALGLRQRIRLWAQLNSRLILSRLPGREYFFHR